MAVNFYLCEEFKFGQENKGFRYLCSSALEYLADGATIIGNIS